MITLEHHYPIWAITLPQYYTDDEDYVTSTGLVQEIKQISTLTGWNEEQHNSKLVGSSRGYLQNLLRTCFTTRLAGKTGKRSAPPSCLCWTKMKPLTQNRMKPP